MNYILSILIILIVIDVYYRFKNQNKFNLITKHLAFVINRYEKILLEKNILTEENVRYTRSAIKANMSEQDFLKLKKIMVAHDDTYLPILTDIIEHSKDNKATLNEVEDAIYMVDKQKLNGLENKVHKEE